MICQHLYKLLKAGTGVFILFTASATVRSWSEVLWWKQKKSHNAYFRFCMDLLPDQ